MDWVEAITENYLAWENQGRIGNYRPLTNLLKIRKNMPVVLHGVSLSIGSTSPVDKSYLRRLKDLASEVEPEWISDHLCFTSHKGKNFHDLLPLPYTEEAIACVVRKVDAVQNFLGRTLLLENVSSYIEYKHSEMNEWEFLVEVARRSECKILLDINNIYVSARNHGFDAATYLESIPREVVGQFHLAGHENNGTHLIDTHDAPVCDAVWGLYERAVKRMPNVSTLLEWDDQFPSWEMLVLELEKARQIWGKVNGKTKALARRSAEHIHALAPEKSA